MICAKTLSIVATGIVVTVIAGCQDNGSDLNKRTDNSTFNSSYGNGSSYNDRNATYNGTNGTSNGAYDSSGMNSQNGGIGINGASGTGSAGQTGAK